MGLPGCQYILGICRGRSVRIHAISFNCIGCGVGGCGSDGCGANGCGVGECVENCFVLLR